MLGAAGAWLVVNLPVMLMAPEGWKQFYLFSRDRNVDFGSVWLLVSQRTGTTITPYKANMYALLLMVVAVVALGFLAFSAPRRPRFAQLAFLVVAAFVLTNKVYSPQNVLWLIPLAALAGDRAGATS
ncbi:membrane protein [Streptomyces narbonensis]